MKHYRYEDRVYSTCSISVSGNETYGTTPVKLECYDFEVIKETLCGYWISFASTKKWVSKTSGKRYAYPTKQQALEGFLRRKSTQIKIYSAKLARAQTAVVLAEREHKLLL